MNQPTFVWRDKNVLITGATGLLGSWMADKLLALKANVVIISRDKVPNSQLYRSGNIDMVTIVDGELEDYFLIERTLNEYEIDSVFHLGAQTIVQTANRSPISTFEANIRGTYLLLEACRISPLVKRVIVASSDKAYGDQIDLPYTEDAPLIGRHPYDVSKSCSDLIAQAYANTYELPIGITRCGNLFGGGDLNYSRIFPGTIRSILKNERPVIRSNGTYIRDYFYVKDAVDAYLFLAENLEKPTVKGQAFNFSNEIQMTVSDIVAKITSLMGSELEPIILDEVKGEINHQYLSAKKAHDLLSWHPSFELDDSILETIEWYKKYFKEQK